MDYITILIKSILTLLTTLFINRFLSIFRKRQLYVTIYDELEAEKSKPGHFTVGLTVGNIGKDKEKGVEIFFPGAKKVHLLSSDYSAISTNGATLKIDRVLSGKKIRCLVLLSSPSSPNKKNKPRIKSEDCDGKSLYGRNAELVPVGGALFVFSFFIALGAVVAYPIIKGIDPFNEVYSFRNIALRNEGFRADIIGSHRLLDLSSPFDKESFIRFKSAELQKNEINIIFEFDNKSNSLLDVKSNFVVRNAREYHKKLMPTYYFPDQAEGEREREKIRSEFNAVERYFDSTRVPPKASSVIEIRRPFNKSLTIEDMIVEIEMTGVIDGEFVTERFTFNPKNSPNATEELNSLLRK